MLNSIDQQPPPIPKNKGCLDFNFSELVTPPDEEENFRKEETIEMILNGSQ